MLGSRRSNGTRIADAAARAAMAVCVAALCAVSTPAGAQGYSRAAGSAQSGAAWNTTNAVTISSGWTTLNSGWPVGQIYSEIGSGSITSGTSPCSASKRQPAFTLPWAFNYGGQSCSNVVMMRGVLFCTGSTSPLSANGPNGAREACESGDRVSDAPGASMDVGEANAGSTAALLPMNGQFLVNDSLVQKPNLDYAFVPMYGGSAPLAYYGEGMGNSTWCFGTDAGCTGNNKMAVQVATSTAGSAPNRVHTIAYRVSWTRRTNATTYAAGCSTVPNTTCFYEWQVQLQENGGNASAQPFRFAYRCANCSGRGTDQFPFSTTASGPYGEPWRKGFIMAYESTNANSSGVYCSGLDQGCIAEQSFTPTVSSTTLAVAVPNPSAYVQGQSVSWTATVSNSGAATNNVNMTFTLPSGVTFSNWACSNGTGGTCAAASGSGTTTTASFSATGSVTYTFNGTVNATTTGNFALAVQASGGTVSDPGAPRAATGSASMRLNNFLVSPSTSSTGICAAGNTLTYTVTARDATNTTIANFAGTVSLSMGAYTSAAWSGTNVTNSGGGAGTVTFTSGSASATLTVTALGSGTASATLGSASGSASTVTFTNNSDASFVVTGVTTTASNPALAVAGRNHTIRLTLNSACVAASGYSGTKTIAIWRTNDVNHPAAAAAPTTGGVALPTSESTTFSVSFTNGVANIVVASTDVGKFAISASDATNTWQTTKISTSTPLTLTVRPFAIVFWEPMYWTGSYWRMSGASGTSGDAWFAGAGQPFQATLRAKRWEAADDLNNDGLPDTNANLFNNADLTSFAAPVTLSLTQTLPTGAGWVTGTLSGTTTLSAASWASGTAAISLSYSEVGSINVQVVANDYLGSTGVSVTGSNWIGRFIAWDFGIEWINSPSLAAACSGATFVGQNFGFAIAPQVRITARGYTGTTLVNYGHPDYFRLWYPGAGTLATTAGVPSGTALGGTTAVLFTEPTNLGNGTASATLQAVSVSFTRGTMVIAPFTPTFRLNNVNFGDNDGAWTGYIGSPTYTFAGNAPVQYGRLAVMSRTAAPEADADVTVRGEYSASGGADWQPAVGASGCFPTLAIAQIALDFAGGIGQCETASASSSTWAGHEATFRLSAPGVGKSGTVTTRLNLGVSGAGNYCVGVGGAYAASSASSAAFLRDVQGGAFVNPSGTVNYSSGGGGGMSARRVFIIER